MFQSVVIVSFNWDIFRKNMENITGIACIIFVNKSWFNNMFSVFWCIWPTCILFSRFIIISSAWRIIWSSSANLNFRHKSLLTNPYIVSVSLKVNTGLARTGGSWYRSPQTIADFPPIGKSFREQDISFIHLCTW